MSTQRTPPVSAPGDYTKVVERLCFLVQNSCSCKSLVMAMTMVHICTIPVVISTPMTRMIMHYSFSYKIICKRLFSWKIIYPSKCNEVSHFLCSHSWPVLVSHYTHPRCLNSGHILDGISFLRCITCKLEIQCRCDGTKCVCVCV